MTKDELIEATARTLALQSSDYDGPELHWQNWTGHAQAALAVIAPAVLDLAAEALMERVHPHPSQPESDWTEYAHCNAAAARKGSTAIRALKERFV